MRNQEKTKNLASLCEDLQAKVYLREVTTEPDNLRFTCDLLLRNMIMILRLVENDKDIKSESKYITNNILAAYAHLTDKDASDVAKEYKIRNF